MAEKAWRRLSLRFAWRCRLAAVKWRGDHDFFDDGCAVNAVKWRDNRDCSLPKRFNFYSLPKFL